MNTGTKEIRAVIRRLIQGLEKRDMRPIEQVYQHSPSLLIFLEGPKMKIVGWNAMKSAISEFLRTHTEIRSRLNRDCRFVADGRLGVFYGTYRFRAVNRKTGKPVKWTARNTFVFQKTRKGWRIIHEHDSFPTPLPGV